MNERIRELSEQAQLHARQGMAKTVIELKRYDADVASERYAKDFEQKFAELIVRECLDIASEVRGEPATDTHFVIGYDRACEKMIDGIKEHFGVEQ